MNEDRAQSLVVGALAAAAAIGAGNAVAQGEKPPLSQLVGFGFAGLGLAVGSMVAPDLAAGLALLMLTTTVFLYGGPLYEAVTQATNDTPTTTRKAPR